MLDIRKKWAHIEFTLALFLFITYLTIYLNTSLFRYLPAVIYTLIFSAYAFVYIIKRDSLKGACAMAMRLLFVLQVVLFFVVFIVPFVILIQEVLNLFSTLHTVGLYFFFAFPVYFVLALGAYKYKVKKDRRIGSTLFALGLAITLIYFTFAVTYFVYGDEVFLAFSAVGQVLHGMNPYTTSVASQLYAQSNTIGGTITTNNTLVGTMDYPALYFMSFAPFYFLGPPTVYALGHVDLKIQAAIYVFIILLFIVFVYEKNEVLKFRFAVLVFLAYAVGTSASINAFLMLLLIMVAYVKIKSKYSFIALGLAASLQQQIWLPVALLLVYSFNNYGWRKGLRDLLGTLLVFLIINGYFIALNPGAFATGVFTPIGKIIPFESFPLSSWLLFEYHVTLSLSGELIAISSVAMVLVLLYFNKKELIPFISVIPLFFIFHGLSGYYTFYAFLLVFALSLKQEKVNGSITRALHRNKALFCAAMVIILAAGIAVTYQSHQDYVNAFNLSVANQSVHFSGSNTIYEADILYHNLANSTVYLYLQGYTHDGGSYLLYGYGNESLIGTNATCQQYYCFVNINRIVLPANGTSYHIRAVINQTNSTPLIGVGVSANLTNTPSTTNYLYAILYNKDYVYKSLPVYNYSK